MSEYGVLKSIKATKSHNEKKENSPTANTKESVAMILLGLSVTGIQKVIVGLEEPSVIAKKLKKRKRKIRVTKEKVV